MLVTDIGIAGYEVANCCARCRIDGYGVIGQRDAGWGQILAGVVCNDLNCHAFFKKQFRLFFFRRTDDEAIITYF